MAVSAAAEGEVREAGHLGKSPRLIDPAAANGVDVDFLEEDRVRLECAEECGLGFQVDAARQPLAMANVEGYYPQTGYRCDSEMIEEKGGYRDLLEILE